jgi:poly(3-hydroxybutyrate) depolymerase
MHKLTLVLGITALALSGCKRADAAPPLPTLKIDTSQTTVSGLSSGGFMANQLGYAYSSTFRGVAVFAAGPYMCAGHSN